MYLVYIATAPCGKKYVGCTSRTLDHRKAEHRRAALVDNRNTKFHRALRIQGFDNFKWHIAHYCGSVAEMFSKEIYTIQRHGSFKNGFNSTPGGDGNVRGRSPTQVMRQAKSKHNLKGYLK